MEINKKDPGSLLKSRINEWREYVDENPVIKVSELPARKVSSAAVEIFATTAPAAPSPAPPQAEPERIESALPLPTPAHSVPIGSMPSVDRHEEVTGGYVWSHFLLSEENGKKKLGINPSLNQTSIASQKTLYKYLVWTLVLLLIVSVGGLMAAFKLI